MPLASVALDADPAQMWMTRVTVQIEVVHGDCSCRERAFQFKAATMMADEKESALLEWLEKEEDENEDETDFKEESLRRSWVVVKHCREGHAP